MKNILTSVSLLTVSIVGAFSIPFLAQANPANFNNVEILIAKAQTICTENTYGGYVNVRSRPDIHSPSLATINNQTVINTAQSAQNGGYTWMYIPAYKGWVRSDYICN